VCFRVFAPVSLARSLSLSLATAADQTHNGGLLFLHTLTWPSDRRTFIHGRTAPLHGREEEEVVYVRDGEILFGYLQTLINMCFMLSCPLLTKLNVTLLFLL